ncbi:hypothetical protein ACTJIJ_23310 [Niabella sp. 22666]|uniref:hypothetical protein n=1 Tax=Niabella sp. 22666 TaxID=3453954 RepID=UPI003F85EF1A
MRKMLRKPIAAFGILFFVFALFFAGCQRNVSSFKENVESTSDSAKMKMKNLSKYTFQSELLSMEMYTVENDIIDEKFVDFANGPYSTHGSVNILSSCQMGAGPDSYVIIDGTIVKATHGRPVYMDPYHAYKHLEMDGFYSVDQGHEGEARGSGIAIKYDFQSGYKYTITFHGYMQDSKMQLRLTNQPIYTNNPCTMTHPAVDLEGLGSQNVFKSLVSSDFNSGYKTIEFEPDSSYEYLWLSGHPYSTASNARMSFALIDISIKKKVPYSIEGPSTFCASATYSVSNLPTGATVSWNLSDNTLGSISSSGSTTTITRTGYGTANLTATITLNGNNIVLTKPITLGYKQPTMTVNGGNTWGGSKFYITGNTEPGTSYRLEVTTPGGAVYTALSEVSLDELGKYWVRLYITNSCVTEKLVYTNAFISVDDGGPIN